MEVCPSVFRCQHYCRHMLSDPSIPNCQGMHAHHLVVIMVPPLNEMVHTCGRRQELLESLRLLQFTKMLVETQEALYRDHKKVRTKDQGRSTIPLFTDRHCLPCHCPFFCNRARKMSLVPMTILYQLSATIIRHPHSPHGRFVYRGQRSACGLNFGSSTCGPLRTL